MSKRKIYKGGDTTERVKVETGRGLTEQAPARQCDMNYILKDYYASGMIKHANDYVGRYDDVTGADFQSAMNIVTSAQRMFEDLPSNLRKRFGGSPAAFLDFVQDPANQAEMGRMGILKGNDGIDITGAATRAPTPPAPTPQPGAPAPAPQAPTAPGGHPSPATS